ncbi:FliH/SctL family protein [Pseudomonas sp. LT1P18]|uniref:FliH/SctL family protein n=1 Tax=Pseudomonas arabinosi TaxID=3398357 RepID=UPI0039EFBA15
MSDLPTQPGPRILRADDAALWVDGYAFLQAAREVSETMRDENSQWMAQARAEGFESARALGAEQAAELLGQTAAQVDAYLAGLESGLVELVLGVVREVLDDMDNAELLVRCTRKALLAFRQDQSLTLFVPLSEVETVRQHLQTQSVSSPSIGVEGDDQLATGQARLSSKIGSVELGLEAQLRNVRRSLLPFSEEISS